MKKYQQKANKIQEDYVDLYNGADSKRAIDLVNVAEHGYAKQVAMVAAVIYDQTDDKQLAMLRAKEWIDNCTNDVTQNIRYAVGISFDKLGFPSPFISDTNAKVVADILEKIRNGNTDTGQGS